ncbi:MAG: hypothetical protein ACHQQQ_09040 [Bacteroidota bacterium]
MKEIEEITSHTSDFLRFIKTKFTLIHQSNVFFRDLHYGVIAYLESKGKKVRYLIGEQIAKEVASDLEKKGIFKKIDHQSWLLNYPEFALPRTEKQAS